MSNLVLTMKDRQALAKHQRTSIWPPLIFSAITTMFGIGTYVAFIEKEYLVGGAFALVGAMLANATSQLIIEYILCSVIGYITRFHVHDNKINVQIYRRGKEHPVCNPNCGSDTTALLVPLGGWFFPKDFRSVAYYTTRFRVPRRIQTSGHSIPLLVQDDHGGKAPTNLHVVCELLQNDEDQLFFSVGALFSELNAAHYQLQSLELQRDSLRRELETARPMLGGLDHIIHRTADEIAETRRFFKSKEAEEIRAKLADRTNQLWIKVYGRPETPEKLPFPCLEWPDEEGESTSVAADATIDKTTTEETPADQTTA